MIWWLFGWYLNWNAHDVTGVDTSLRQMSSVRAIRILMTSSMSDRLAGTWTDVIDVTKLKFDAISASNELTYAVLVHRQYSILFYASFTHRHLSTHTIDWGPQTRCFWNLSWGWLSLEVKRTVCSYLLIPSHWLHGESPKRVKTCTSKQNSIF